MNHVLSLLIAFTTLGPTLALAEEAHGGSYRELDSFIIHLLGPS